MLISRVAHRDLLNAFPVMSVASETRSLSRRHRSVILSTRQLQLKSRHTMLIHLTSFFGLRYSRSKSSEGLTLVFTVMTSIVSVSVRE